MPYILEDIFEVILMFFDFQVDVLQIAKPNGPFCGAERPQCGASGQPFPT